MTAPRTTRIWHFPAQAKADNFTKFILRNGFRMTDLLVDPIPDGTVYVTMVDLFDADFNAAARLAHNDGGKPAEFSDPVVEPKVEPTDDPIYREALSHLRP